MENQLIFHGNRGGYLKTSKTLEDTFDDSVFHESRLDFYLFLKTLQDTFEDTSSFV